MTQTVSMVGNAGKFAEDKDVARTLRKDVILPALDTGEDIVLDFAGVENATQSFMHACIAEPLRLGGHDALRRLVFKACDPVVRSVVETVVEYSIRAYALSIAPTPALLMATDVPQADNLMTIRKVSDAVALGSTTPEDLSAATGYSIRHVHYRMHAGRILGFVIVAGRNLVGPTDEAYELLDTEPGGPEELELFERAMRTSPILKILAPELLGKKQPTKPELAERIAKRTHLGQATSARRAQTLLAWRRYVLQRQLALGNIRRPRAFRRHVVET